MVALKHDLPVFMGSTTSTVGFKFLSDTLQVRTLFIHAIDYGGCFAEFSGFKADANTLLFLFYFSTNAQVLW